MKEDSNTLAHAVLDSVEFILTACFSRLLGQSQDVGMSIKGAGAAKKLTAAVSLIDSTVTSELVNSCFRVIFDQFRRYLELLNIFDPIDWQLFSYKMKQMNKNNEKLDHNDDQPLYDELSEEQRQNVEDMQEPMKEGNQVTNELIKDFIDKKASKEVKKVHQMYDVTSIQKLLRLVEIFTSIGIDDDHIKALALNQSAKQTVVTLLNLLVYCQMDHSFICIRIIKNLIQVGIEEKVLDKASAEVLSTHAGKCLASFELKVHFEDSPFLQFCYNLVYKIRSCQWSSDKFDGYGSYDISCEVVRLLKSILRSSKHPIWKQSIESIMDEFIANVDTYTIEEFDIITSLFEGGEYNGLNIGSAGQSTDGKKFTIAGFAEDWFGEVVKK